MRHLFFSSVILTLCLICTTLCQQQQFIQLLPTIHVHVVSRVPNQPTPLKIRCQSKDDDLGNHTLSNGQEFQWKFTPRVFGGTLFFCHFYWGPKDKSFVVFDDDMQPHCETNKDWQCYWEARPDGFYFGNGKSWALKQTW